MPAGLSQPGRRAGDEPPPDRGCQYAPRCVTCPWSTCVKELPARERIQLADAFRVVRRYVRAPETVIPLD